MSILQTVDDLKYVLLVLLGLITAAIGLWVKRSKAALEVFGNGLDRTRMLELMKDAADAKQEAHEVKNDMMKVQRRMGELEAENRWLKTENDKLQARVSVLEGKKTINPNASDFRP